MFGVFSPLLAEATEGNARPPLVSDPAGILAVLLCVLALIFWFGQTPRGRALFKYVPALIFCYFLPTTLSTLNVIPTSSPLYEWVKDVVLPASLVLLILALDIPGLLRLGPKALIMMLAGTVGVIVGAPVALWIGMSVLPPASLPEDVWRGLTALSGSWIGGGANFVALGKMAEASDDMIALMVIPDVFIANCWMAVLLFAAGIQDKLDRLLRADASAIRDLEQRLHDFQQRVARTPTLPDLMLILAIAFGVAWVCRVAGAEFDGWIDAEIATLGSAATGGAFVTFLNNLLGSMSGTTWMYIFVTTVGLLLSLTPARNLEGAGASKIGSVMIYILVACIGAHADFSDLNKQPALMFVAAIWMLVHIAVLLTTAVLIRAPAFFVAVGSQANIGGAASAPVVAGAFHPALAPVGALLAVLGYVLGTYGGLICMSLLKAVAGG